MRTGLVLHPGAQPRGRGPQPPPGGTVGMTRPKGRRLRSPWPPPPTWWQPLVFPGLRCLKSAIGGAVELWCIPRGLRAQTRAALGTRPEPPSSGPRKRLLGPREHARRPLTTRGSRPRATSPSVAGGTSAKPSWGSPGPPPGGALGAICVIRGFPGNGRTSCYEGLLSSHHRWSPATGE